MKEFDFQSIKSQNIKSNRYNYQITRISNGSTRSTKNIEETVTNALKNINNGARSFVIFGEPQSGKTEMMIALSAKLIDENYKIILILLNDSIDLLTQNLDRFQRSGLDPSPENYTEILDKLIKIEGTERIIFCKKNSKDLQKLIEKIGNINNKIIIDDEADYASPNAKINQEEKSKINFLIEKLLFNNGIYIGVTATPARLDLNNTFENNTEQWVDFSPHEHYRGQETFFPTNLSTFNHSFIPSFLPDKNDDPKYLRDAFFNFLVNVAHLNLINLPIEKNYSMLIHTSGKTVDHTSDYQEISKILEILKIDKSSLHEKYYKELNNIAQKKYNDNEQKIVGYIYNNRNRTKIVVINSDKDSKTVDPKTATNPATLFTIAIGGNIISRGVTFDNLLCMFFTRDVKHKIQQDTYIQRARMFGSRGEYLDHFELYIPEQLYLDWHKCFVFHRLSIESIKSNNKAPVWIESSRMSSVAKASIDKSNVHINSGEMSFALFDYNENINNVFFSKKLKIERIRDLAMLIGDESCPKFLINFIDGMSPFKDDSIVILNTTNIKAYKDADIEAIKRNNGGAIRGDTESEKLKRPNAIHYLKIFINDFGKARLFYNYREHVKFLSNFKK